MHASAVRFARTSGGLAALVVLHSVLVLLGWWRAWPLFVQPPQHFIPMAPTTALAFLALGLGLLARVCWRDHAAARRWSWLAGAVVALTAVLNLASPIELDRLLGGARGQFGPVPLGVMSPITAGAVLLLALTMVVFDQARRSIGLLASVASAVGATVALGYAYGAPLLYGSTTIPVALPTGLSLLFLGVAVVPAAGSDVWPLSAFVGESPGARMRRAFVPTTAVLVVLIGLLQARLPGVGANPRVLVTAWVALGGAGVVAVLVSRLARRIGAEIDHAYVERHRAERRYAQVFEQTPAGVATTTLGGRIQLCNEAFARMFGFSTPADLVGQSAETLYWEAEDRERVIGALQEGGRLRNMELRLRRRDGRPVWVLANVTLHRGEGEPEIENTLLDITDRKALEQQLWQAQKLDALGSLAGGVAHDFNNVLTAILANTELVQLDTPPGDQRSGDLEEIRKACERAASLTRQLLAFSRRQPFEPKAVRLDELVRDLSKMLYRLLGPQVRLVTTSEPDLALVWADPTQIEQVIMNLAVNARDAMPEGGTVAIETGNARLDEPLALGEGELSAGAYVVLAVSDTGTGMDRETLGRIFEPFFTTKEKGKGTGLGLATVYGILRQSRGKVLVYSEPGVGTTFKCYLPVSEGDVPTSLAPVVVPAVEGGGETILLVEDDPAIREAVTAGLRRQGYRVLPASDGDAAMRVAADHARAIQLVLCDGVLSGVRVPELLRRLRVQRPNTRVLLMSGYSREAVFLNDVVDPATAFLSKPFTIQQLTQRVREVLDQTIA
jgi:PAS domain S-box-containing protein